MTLQRRTGSLLLCILLTAVGVFGTRLPQVAEGAAQGGTVSSVSPDGNTVTITVNMDFCCGADAFQQDNIINTFVRDAQVAWNQALAQLPYQTCRQIRVVFVAHNIQTTNGLEPGYHRIWVGWDRPGRSSSDDPGMTNARQDTTTAYDQNLVGHFYPDSLDLTGWEHEIGHLMGLGNDYQDIQLDPRFPYTGSVDLPGRAGTLMSTSGNKIDRVLADRIVNIAKRAGMKVNDCPFELRYDLSTTESSYQHGAAGDGPQNAALKAHAVITLTRNSDGTYSGSGPLIYDQSTYHSELHASDSRCSSLIWTDDLVSDGHVAPTLTATVIPSPGSPFSVLALRLSIATGIDRTHEVRQGCINDQWTNDHFINSGSLFEWMRQVSGLAFVLPSDASLDPDGVSFVLQGTSGNGSYTMQENSDYADYWQNVEGVGWKRTSPLKPNTDLTVNGSEVLLITGTPGQ